MVLEAEAFYVVVVRVSFAVVGWCFFVFSKKARRAERA